MAGLDDISLILAKAYKSGFLQDIKEEERAFYEQEALRLFGDDVALSATYAPASGSAKYARSSSGGYRPLVAKLRTATSPATLLVMGDSTGIVNATPWPTSLAQKLATTYPNWAVELNNWNVGTNSYDAPIAVSAGVAAPPVTDSFTRTSTTTLGTSTSGQSWTTISGLWGTDGTRAYIPTAGPGVNQVASITTRVPDYTFSFDVVIPATVGTAAQAGFALGLRSLGPTTEIQFVANITAGSSNINLYRLQYNAPAIAIGTNAAPGLALGTTYTVTGSVVGRTISVTINGVTLSYTLTLADQRLFLTPNRFQLEIQGGQNQVGVFIDNMTITPKPLKLTVWNGSASGRTNDYSAQYFSTMAPVIPDQIIINHGHNEFWQDAGNAHYMLVRQTRDYLAAVPIALTIQNPRGPLFDDVGGDSDRVNDLARASSAQRVATSEGLDLIDVRSLFLSNATHVADWLNSDQLHPNDTGAGVWADEVLKFLNGQPPTAGLSGVPSRVFIPASNLMASEGTPATGLVNGVPGTSLVHGSGNQSVVGVEDIPSSWAWTNIYAVWTTATTSGLTGANNSAVFELLAGALLGPTGSKSGVNLSANYLAGFSLNSRGTVTETVQNGTGIVYSTLLTPNNKPFIDLGRPVALQVRRQGGAGGDTFLGSVNLIGILIERLK